MSSPIQTPVTGSQDTTDQRQAAHALAQFYRLKPVGLESLATVPGVHED